MVLDVGVWGVVVLDVGVRLRFFVVEEVFGDLTNSFLFILGVLLGVNPVESNIFIFGGVDTGDLPNRFLFTS